MFPKINPSFGKFGKESCTFASVCSCRGGKQDFDMTKYFVLFVSHESSNSDLHKQVYNEHVFSFSVYNVLDFSSGRSI